MQRSNSTASAPSTPVKRPATCDYSELGVESPSVKKFAIDTSVSISTISSSLMSSLDCIRILLEKNEVRGAQLLVSQLEEKISASFVQLSKMMETSVNRLQCNDLTIRYLRHTIDKMRLQQSNEGDMQNLNEREILVQENNKQGKELEYVQVDGGKLKLPQTNQESTRLKSGGLRDREFITTADDLGVTELVDNEELDEKQEPFIENDINLFAVNNRSDVIQNVVTQVEELSVKTPSRDRTPISSSNTDNISPLRPELRSLPQWNYVEVFFDLETTGLCHTSHITQLSAMKDSVTFDRYVRPKKSIPADVTKVTGLTYESHQMYLHGKPVKSVSLRECLKDFSVFLGDDRCLLVGHNAGYFDGPILLLAARSVGVLDELKLLVVGFLDTLPLFKKEFPNLCSYSQPALVERFLSRSYVAHNAVNDVRMLKKLVKFCEFDWEKIHPFTITWDNVEKTMLFLNRRY